MGATKTSLSQEQTDFAERPEKRCVRKGESAAVRSKETAQRLVHELRSTRLNWNAECGAETAREELELSRNKYLELYDFALSAISPLTRRDG